MPPDFASPDLSPELKTVACPRCPLCHEAGEPFHTALRDEAFGAPGCWNFRKCRRCGTLWLDPRPAPERLDLFYPPQYLTHSPPRDLFGPAGDGLGRLRFQLKLEVLHRAYGYKARSAWRSVRLAGRLAARLPGWRRRVGFSIRFVPAGPGRLLDVGCGNGEFLLTMTRLGWKVCGLEPDSAAAELARACGLQIENQPIESARLVPESFGAITLHHVLEHLPDPVAAMQKLGQALQPGGVLVSVSPNPAGTLAGWFGRSWRELDPPRHFALFPPDAVARLAWQAGLIPKVFTITRMSEWVAQESLTLRERRNRWMPRLLAAACEVAARVDRAAGEEVVLLARRPSMLR